MRATASASPSASPDSASRRREIRKRFNAYRETRRELRSERPPPRVAVPSFFTLLNLFCGFLALTQVWEGNFVIACWLIVMAGFLDLLDGMMARLANAVSPFGVELDSLSDVVSFGVAPAFLVYVYSLHEFGPLGFIVAALPALCGAVRLARYNMNFDGEKKDYFEGLPIPVQAVALVALILTAENAAWGALLAQLQVIVPAVIVLSALMVSSIDFDAIPRPTVAYIRKRPQKVLAYVLAGLLVIALQEVGLLVALTLYVTHGMGQAAYRLGKALMTPVSAS
ncbi:MAG: CDP-diacylglycerol--serine O-phosphatidyltransferase [Longimonas sp.]|uniref:CDP-diacylglycerol--serine O-phosphatidyltransferase n=1 Tax=Longimonas sp. TaxID=2039626 RepID=UPI00335DF7FE